MPKLWRQAAVPGVKAPEACIVLAGGLGTRLRQHLSDIPKPMAIVAGRPFIDWIVLFLAANGLTELIISTGYRAEVIEAHFRNNPPEGLNVRCMRESTQLGTGGAVGHALGAKPFGSGACLVCNGDSLALASLTGLFSAVQDDAVDGAMLGLNVQDASRYGVLEFSRENILISMTAQKEGPAIINSGIYLLRSRLLDDLSAERPLSLEKEVIPRWIRQGRRIKVIEACCPFLDMGTPESLAEATTFVGAHHALIMAGGRLSDD